MKVYIVRWHDGYDVTIDRVFKKEEDAKKFCDDWNDPKNHYYPFDWQEYEVE